MAVLEIRNPGRRQVTAIAHAQSARIGKKPTEAIWAALHEQTSAA